MLTDTGHFWNSNKCHEYNQNSEKQVCNGKE